MDGESFGYNWPAPASVEWPAEWAVSGFGMARCWREPYVRQFEAFAGLVRAPGPQQWAACEQLLESYSRTFRLMQEAMDSVTVV